MATLSEPSLSSPKYAENFPEGYGDFAFQSSDGVIFHFPKFLLSFVSPVFKDMYDMVDSAASDEILKLTEDAETLDSLLRVIDPTKDSPSLIQGVVERLLNAADKYQIDGVQSWHKKEVELETFKRSSFAARREADIATTALWQHRHAKENAPKVSLLSIGLFRS
jgi:hypothetical protein